MAQYQLDAKKILDKEFHVDLKGYSPSEVDEFLDLVISDYQLYEQTMQELGEKLRSYENQIDRLQEEIAQLRAQKGEEPAAEVPSSSQLDILKRLSRLEFEVFKK